MWEAPKHSSDRCWLSPTTFHPGSPLESAKHGVYLVFPTQASAALKTATEERRRSLFKVPVFQADLKLDATFDLTGVPAAAPQGAELDWSRSEIVVGVTDARGALADAMLTTDGKTSTLVPAEIAQKYISRGDQSPFKLTLFGSRVEEHCQAKCAIQRDIRLEILWRSADCGPCVRQDNTCRCAGRLAESRVRRRFLAHFTIRV